MLEVSFDLGPLHFRFALGDQSVADSDDVETGRDSAVDAMVEHASEWRHPDHELDARPAPIGFRA